MMDEYVSYCPACGEPIDYCQGHGEIGDPAGYQILQDHDGVGWSNVGWHRDCHPLGCEDALAAEFPEFAWPGGYTMEYLHEHDIICYECAREVFMDTGGEVYPPGFTYDEGPVQHCSMCEREIESSYGDPWGEEG